MSEIKTSVQDVAIEEEMRGAYLDYAMSVIVGRALPDVRDGLKPVHRRVLYAMYDMGNTYDKPYKKSARVVGDVIGKYHPHGDVAVYDTIVRLAQDFSMRYRLVDGQGNFGSVDGDAPAAMRYTEVRMTKVTDQILADLDKETVDFGPNYDDSLKEPHVLPCRFPNLLVNGASGIAVGMATSIPPHNLDEVISATIALIEDPTLDSLHLLKFIKGPDFPTGGIILADGNLPNAYKTGRGSFIVRGRAEIETHKGDRERIIVTELPYQVNKARMIEKIAELVKDKRLEGISDLRDESSRQGMRVVVDIKKGENASVILNQLYKLTQLQETISLNLLAIDHGQPKTFGVRGMLWAFVEHRKDVVVRRTYFDLSKAEDRAHILEGLEIAISNLDAVVSLIRASTSGDEAKSKLVERFSMSVKQAQAVLDLRLQRLTGLEREKITRDLVETKEIIADLKGILASEPRVFQIIKDELVAVKEAFGDKRRTEIVHGVGSDFVIEDLIPNDPTLVSITNTGYIKRTDPAQFRSQRRGGRGIKGVATHEEDFVTAIYHTTNHSQLLCFTNRGKAYSLKVYKIPEAARTGKGKAIVNLLSLTPGEKVVAILPVEKIDAEAYLAFATKNGLVKRTTLKEFSNIRNSGLIALTIEEDDDLVAVRTSTGQNDIFLCSKDGMSIRFNESEVRSVGRTAMGVKGMELDSGDHVVGMEVINPGDSETEMLTVTEGGIGKRTALVDYRVQSRGGKGVISIKLGDSSGSKVVGSRLVTAKEGLMLVTDKGQLIKIRVGDIREQGRNTQGVRLMNLMSGEKLVNIEKLAETDDDAAASSVETTH